MSDVDLKEIIGRAILVCERRGGDVSFEDESDKATTDIDELIHLEQALADAFNPNGDDANMEECWDAAEKYFEETQRLRDRVESLENQAEFDVAMMEAKSSFILGQEKELAILRDKVSKLTEMIENGLGFEDLEDDISIQNTI